MTAAEPLVRVVIVNYNGGDLTLRCIESVKLSDWPSSRLEIVVVDNASRDGSAESIEHDHPDARLVRAPKNLGYAGATNLALADLDEVTHVALLNNDAEVGRVWLRPLVAAMEADPTLGAVVPKIVFRPTYHELALHTLPSPPRVGDRRSLGVRLRGIRIGGHDHWSQVHFAGGWHYLEYDGDVTRPFRWTADEARLLIPAATNGSPSVELLLDSDRPKTLELRSGDRREQIHVTPTPTWIDVPVGGESRDVINSVGSILVRGGYGADRGMLERDGGQYEQPAEVFAWSGCCVLLRRAYLADVGLLEPRFFLYYEDFDLSWRGRARGWRYRYIPAATVRHRHTSSTLEGSALFEHYVERNRLFVHVRNAPPRYAVHVGGRFLWEVARQVRRDVIRPLLWRQRPRGVFVSRRLQSLGALLLLLPSAVSARHRLRRRQRVPDTELMKWLEPPEDRALPPGGDDGR